MRAARWWILFAISCGPATKTAPVVSDPATPAPAPAGPAAPAADPAPPELRLPAVARPLHNSVELVLDPSTEDFTGTIVTQLEVVKPTTVIWLHQKEITVDDVVLDLGGAAKKPRTVTPQGKEYLGLVFAEAIAPGKGKLTIRYRGKMHRNDGDGIYTAQVGTDWYAFTQFEAMDARSAFPTFDEPSFKVPWQLAIHTKKPLMALANTAIASEQDEPNGMKVVRFAETRPLPSYLVAFAVGPFERVEAGKTRAGQPIGIVVPRGRTKDAAYPAEVTKPILDLLEDYFGTPYPYDKLDLLSCSVFNAGAMENPGLITWREELLLTRPADLTLGKQKTHASITAHEMAHMWFGDYVTLAWWDDTWLNEAFATWAASKVIEKWKPDWDVAVESVSSKSMVMGQDSLDSARAIRQPIATTGDVLNAFDGITYQKGEAVLRMLERRIGPDVFQKGVREYLQKHAWGNATYEDFVAGMTSAAGRDLRPMFDSFVLQSGVPLVSAELSCAGAPKLALTQQRYVPTGSKIDPKRLWQLPICVRWGAGGATGRDCTTLATETGELALSAKTCPDWVLPNEDGLGYYRMRPKADQLTKLLAVAPKALSLAERVGLLGDVNALVASGDVQNGVALSLVETLSKDKSRHIVDAGIGVVAGIDELVPDNLRPNYERLIKKLYRARAKELGWQPRRGEDQNLKELRPNLLALVGGAGRDAEVIKEATALSWKWLDDHATLDKELVGTALHIAGRYGDQKLFDRLLAEAKKATDKQDRMRFLAAMGAFVDAKIIPQAMALLMSDQFDIRESGRLLQGAFADPRVRPVAYKFVTENFDAITAKLPELYRPYMAFTFVALCDEARKPEIEAFYKPRITAMQGGDRIYAQALETLSLCAASRKAQTPGVIAFLKRQ
jgi:alanyl aminopeptidase